MKLYTEEQVRKAMIKSLGYSDDVIGFYPDVEILKSLTPIELPSHRDITERANQQVDKTIGNYFVGFAACSEYYEQILRQLPIIKTNGTSTSQVDTNEIRN